MAILNYGFGTSTRFSTGNQVLQTDTDPETGGTTTVAFNPGRTGSIGNVVSLSAEALAGPGSGDRAFAGVSHSVSVALDLLVDRKSVRAELYDEGEGWQMTAAAVLQVSSSQGLSPDGPAGTAIARATFGLSNSLLEVSAQQRSSNGFGSMDEGVTEFVTVDMPRTGSTIATLSASVEVTGFSSSAYAFADPVLSISQTPLTVGAQSFLLNQVAVLRVTGGGNFLSGDGSDGQLRGTGKDDLLVGRAGERDGVFGFGGDDTYRAAPGGDVFIGGGGVDTVDYSGSANGVLVSLNSGGELFGFGKRGARNDLFDGVENVTGSPHADVLRGDGAANALNGKGADDRLIGLRGADALDGGNGDDELFGGTGRDLLTGGNGNDLMVGGRGPDTFVWTDRREGQDVVRGFEDGSDILNFEGTGLAFRQIGIDPAGDGASTQVTAGRTVILIEDVAPSEIGRGDFIL